MSIQLSPAGPWIKGQLLTDANGFPYQAQDANLAKPYCAPIVIMGAAGDKGPTGGKGPNGLNGANGANGTNGTNGVNGQDGVTPDCSNCFGPPGDQGPVGEQGPPGDQGAPGTGVPGDKGPPGDQGPVGDKGPDGDPGDDGEDVGIRCEQTNTPTRGINFITDTGGVDDPPCHIDFEQCCEVECVQRTVCGKVIAPEFTVTPDAVVTQNGGPSAGTWTAPNGIVVTFNYTGNMGQQPGSIDPDCFLLRDVPGETITYAISGVDALAFDNCPACVTVNPVIHSLDPGVTFDSGTIAIAAVDTTGPVGTTYTGAGTGDGDLTYEETVETDGQFFSGVFGGPSDITQACLQNVSLQLPVKIVEESCDNGTTWDFISATDEAGNTYTEAEVDY